MRIFILNFFLALIWASLLGDVSLNNLIVGFILAYIILGLLSRVKDSHNYFQKAKRIIGFLLYFLKEMLYANFQVAYEIITPSHKCTPGIIAVPLDAKTDIEIILLANCITLTPGTLSIDVSDDRKVLFVHAVFVDDADRFRKEVKEGFEKRLLEILR